jgi:hypothetical protein
VYKCLFCNLTYIPSDICLWVILLDHMVVLFWVFWETSILLLIVVMLIYIPTNLVTGFFFCSFLPTFVVCILDDRHSDWSEVKSQCSFDLHFLYSQGCWTFLHVLIGHLYFCCWKLSVQLIWPFLYWVFDSLWG